MTELQKEFNKLKDKYKEMNKRFDSDNEALEYYKKQVKELKEEAEIVLDRCNKYTYIVDHYDNYMYCYKDYILERYYNYKAFIIIQFLIFIASIILLLYIPDIRGKLIISMFTIYDIIYNLGVIIKVEIMKKKIKDDLFREYQININDLTEEEIEIMSLTALNNKLRENSIFDEIREFSFFANMKISDILEKKEENTQKNKK